MRKTITVPAACRERFASLGDALLAPWSKAGFTRAGVSRVVDGYHIASPHCEDVIVIATISGKGRFISRTESLLASSGMVVICPASTPVIFSCEGSEWHFAWCYLDAQRWPCSRQVQVQRWQGNAVWAASLEGALQLIAHHRNTRPRGIRLQVDMVVDELSALFGQVRGESETDAYEEAWQSVLDSLHESWPLVRFSKRVDQSVPTVQRWARRRFQCSFHQELLKQRMQQAANLLASSDYTLTQVASLLGYADAFTFSAAFRQQQGCAPSVWRKRQQKPFAEPS